MVKAATDNRFASQAIKEQGIGLSDKLAQVSGVLGDFAEFAIDANLDAGGNSIAVQRQQINLEAAQRTAQEDEEARRSVALDADAKRTRMRNPTEQQWMDCGWGAGARHTRSAAHRSCRGGDLRNHQSATSRTYR